MSAAHIKNNILIIGGTIKGATSSVFTYLAVHPDVSASSIKETFFFTKDYTGDAIRDIKAYKCFFPQSCDDKVLLEASPNYLGYKENVAPRIKSLLPEAKMLFILRNPVGRFYSYYNFAIGKLELPKSLGFEAYFQLCKRYASGELTPETAGIAEKHLRALELGEYSQFIKNYTDLFSSAQVKVVFYDDLRESPEFFMQEICRFIGVDPNFYSGFTFSKSNVTFSARLAVFHHVAMLLNRVLESVLRKNPEIKKMLVSLYKRFNQDREGYVAMQDETRNSLLEYYSVSNKTLSEMLAGQKLPAWLK